MKKSELKQLIKEALIEVLPDILQSMNFVNESNINTLPKPPRGFEKYKASKPSYDLPDESNRKAVINGEEYVSGKGIMEWFSKQSNNKPASEFVHTERDMDSFISKKFGV